MKYNAAIIYDEAESFIRTGHGGLLIQQAGADKNVKRRRDDDYVAVPIRLKSRVAGGGKHKDVGDICIDSPTGDVNAHELVFRAACASVVIRPAGAANMRLLGLSTGRILLYRTPWGYIPKEGIDEGSTVADRVTVCGIRDADCKFRLRSEALCAEHRFVLNYHARRCWENHCWFEFERT